jgi:hypothetical protein
MAIRAALESIPSDEWTRELKALNQIAGEIAPKKGRVCVLVHGNKGDSLSEPMSQLAAIDKKRWWATNFPDIKVEIVPAPAKEKKPKAPKKKPTK